MNLLLDIQKTFNALGYWVYEYENIQRLRRRQTELTWHEKRERNMQIRSTSDLRKLLQETYDEIENGIITNNVARTRVHLVRAFIDTLKVEIAAASLGRDLNAVSFYGEIKPLPLENKNDH